MKCTFIYFIAVLFTAHTYSQQPGTILAKKPSPKAGVENLYEYQPAAGFAVPEKAMASVLYFNKTYLQKNIPITKAGSKYEFAFKAPDSTDVLVIAIFDKDNNVIDNNKEAGYTSYLHDAKGKQFATAKVKQAVLLSGFAAYFHKVKVPPATLVAMYEAGYKENPALKDDDFYSGYLALLYQEKKEEVKPQLIGYAKQMLATTGDEGKWLKANQVYAILKMPEDQQKTKDKILAAYPQGKLAMQEFWSKFNKEKDKTEASILAAMNQYQQSFKDSSAKTRDNFYLQLVSLFSKNKDWNNVLKYGALVDNKLWLASSYNNTAWDLSGGGLEGEAKEIGFAKVMSKLSLDYVDAKRKELAGVGNSDELKGQYNMYSDTYALILYKLKNYDSAFYYQDAIFKAGHFMGTDGLERYAVFAEKAKGASFSKDFIEPQLLNGVNSPVMVKHLKALYQQLNLPEEGFLKIKEKVTAVTKQKLTEKVVARFGGTKGAELNLKDLQGNMVSLASLKGKIVILDFWATWCGPCKASFPHMQELVNKYKADPDVVFLFIDTWERIEPKAMQENAAKFIKDNNYSFKVLLDEKDKVVGDYKVEGIPAKFILDKKGDIVFMGEGGSDLSLIIDAAKEL